MIKSVDHVAAMASYPLADLSAPAGKRLLLLSQNESMRSPSPLALAAAENALADANLYPDSNWTELRSAIAKIHNIPAGDIVCGTGSLDLIGCIAHAYADAENAILSTQYGYLFFQTAAQFSNARFDVAPEVNFTVSADALLAKVAPDTRVVFVANPGNPTGTRIPKSELLRLRTGLPKDTLLVIDEAYGEFSDGMDDPIFDMVNEGNTVVLRTFSKAYGLAGMRVGWGYFPPKIGAEVRKLLNPSNISGVSQAAATAAVQDQSYMKETVALTATQRDRFFDHVRDLGLVAPESYTNFVLVKLPSTDTAASAENMLRNEGILVRGMKGYGLPDCLRITIGTKADMDFTAKTLTLWHKTEAST
jgi:histidinol-phosphate aminotransferase